MCISISSARPLVPFSPLTDSENYNLSDEQIAASLETDAPAVWRECPQCEAPFEVTRRRERFCCRRCASTFASRASAEQRGDSQRFTRHGGVQKYYPRYMGQPLHRAVYEKYWGVTLSPSDVIHHIDGNSLNNSPLNLLRTDAAGHCVIEKPWTKTARYRARVVPAASESEQVTKMPALISAHADGGNVAQSWAA